MSEMSIAKDSASETIESEQPVPSVDMHDVSENVPDADNEEYLESFNIDMGSPGASDAADVPHYIINLNMYNADGATQSEFSNVGGLPNITSDAQPSGSGQTETSESFSAASSRPGSQIPQPFLRPMFRTKGRSRGRHCTVPLNDVMEQKIRTFEGRDCVQHLDQLQRMFPRFKRAYINRLFTRNMLNYDKTFHQLNEENNQEIEKCAKIRLVQSSKSESKRDSKTVTKPGFVGLNPESYMYLGVPLGRCPPHIANTLYRRVIVNPDGSVESADEHEQRFLNKNGITPDRVRRGGSRVSGGIHPRLSGSSHTYQSPSSSGRESSPPRPASPPSAATLETPPSAQQAGNKFFRSNRMCQSDDKKRGYVSRELRNAGIRGKRGASLSSQSKTSLETPSDAVTEEGDAVKYMASVGVVSNSGRRRSRRSSRGLKDAAELSDNADDAAATNEDEVQGDGLELTDEERGHILAFFNEALLEELALMPGCSRKTAQILTSLRPFNDMSHLLSRLSETRHLSPNLIEACKELLQMRSTVVRLLQRCERLSQRVTSCAAGLLKSTVSPTAASEKETSQSKQHPAGDNPDNSVPTDDTGEHDDSKPDESMGFLLSQQPAILNPLRELKPYQLVGLNWLRLLHHEKVNGILADEMGLGKTVQAIAFLASLWESGDRGPHLIICPSSTQDNWQHELADWCPHLKVLVYQGSAEQRKAIRLKVYEAGAQTDFNILLTSYAVGTSSLEDRALMKRVNFHYGIFDEAHMLKNMTSQRYKHLVNFRVQRRILLTGTPLQNNLLELISLLSFVMPDMFMRSTDLLKRMFQIYSKPVGARDNGDTAADTSDGETVRSKFELERLEQAKNLLQPFCLRRLKTQVLDQLPPKTNEIIKVPMTASQAKHYWFLVDQLRELTKDSKQGTDAQAATTDIIPKPDEESGEAPMKKQRMDGDPAVNGTSEDRADDTDASKASSSPSNMVMKLRKAANHELLLSRIAFSDTNLRSIAQTLHLDPSHANSDPNLIYEDLLVLSDHQVHKICQHYDLLNSYTLPPDAIVSGSGKIVWLEANLPRLIAEGHRVLIFSQFVLVLDVIEEFLRAGSRRYIRLDGSTPVAERQQLIDRFNSSSIEVFLLSTRAGGLGINLTGADTVIIHDIDFNPYTDKQAEDRVHRLGQTKPVHVIRLISEGTVEEGILRIATEKLELEQNVTGTSKEDFLDADTGVDDSIIDNPDGDVTLKVLGSGASDRNNNNNNNNNKRTLTASSSQRGRPDDVQLWSLLSDALKSSQ